MNVGAPESDCVSRKTSVWLFGSLLVSVFLSAAAVPPMAMLTVFESVGSAPEFTQMEAKAPCAAVPGRRMVLPSTVASMVALPCRALNWMPTSPYCWMVLPCHEIAGAAMAGAVVAAGEEAEAVGRIAGAGESDSAHADGVVNKLPVKGSRAGDDAGDELRAAVAGGGDGRRAVPEGVVVDIESDEIVRAAAAELHGGGGADHAGVGVGEIAATHREVHGRGAEGVGVDGKLPVGREVRAGDREVHGRRIARLHQDGVAGVGAGQRLIDRGGVDAQVERAGEVVDRHGAGEAVVHGVVGEVGGAGEIVEPDAALARESRAGVHIGGGAGAIRGGGADGRAREGEAPRR